VLRAEVVEEAVQFRRQLSRGLLEAEHELVILGTLRLAVVLLVGPVVLEDLVRVLGDADLFGRELLVERIAEVSGGYLQLLDLRQRLLGRLHLHVQAGASTMAAVDPDGGGGGEGEGRGSGGGCGEGDAGGGG